MLENNGLRQYTCHFHSGDLILFFSVRTAALSFVSGTSLTEMGNPHICLTEITYEARDKDSEALAAATFTS